LISQGVPPLEGVKQGWGSENICAKCINIPKTLGDTTKVTINN